MADFNMADITIEDYMKLKKKFDEAGKDDTPYVAVVDDEMNVIGDPNKTERKKGTYEISFGFPNTEMWRKKFDEKDIIYESENYIGVRRKYEDVWIPPRVQTAVMSAFVELYRFFVIASPDGNIRDLSIDETSKALEVLSQEMVEALCHAVATVLRLDQQTEEFMLPMSSALAMMQMANDFPELINGADFFSESSSEKR